MDRKTKASNSRIISHALLKGEAEFVWLTDVADKPVRVLKESLHKDETIFYNAGNDVDFDPARHKRSASPLGRGTEGVG